MGEALNLYRRLGFTLAPPAYPAMALSKGTAPEPFGAANTHVFGNALVNRSAAFFPRWEEPLSRRCARGHVRW
ncbi:hypothetical protein QFZ49_007214 [Streptomyces turgidiscabies]|uniref:Acetyltransferase n=1 Tax=Streptomyces turgidiscabies TaxID=85558 RepID=A0ABU0RZ20_9ACTN|nr:hypothetical protein [Streptomyces turgidiscabies]